MGKRENVAFQFFKNIFLQMNFMDPLFDFDSSAEEMARYQYEMLTAMYELGIPTAQPLGCHPLKGNFWFFLAEFLKHLKMIDGTTPVVENIIQPNNDRDERGHWQSLNSHYSTATK